MAIVENSVENVEIMSTIIFKPQECVCANCPKNRANFRHFADL
jgi:hypothetical protein